MNSSITMEAFFVPNIKNSLLYYPIENKKVKQQKNKQRWIGLFCWVNSPHAGLYNPFVNKNNIDLTLNSVVFFLKNYSDFYSK